MPYTFGRDFTFRFFPIRDEVSHDDIEDLTKVTTAPAIYVFTTKPTRAVAAAGTGAQQGPIVAWADTADGRGKEFTVTAIDDPDTSGGTDKYDYYIAINFYLQDSEQIQTVIRHLPMMRIVAHHSSGLPEITDLDAIHPNFSSFFSEHEIDGALKTARNLVRAELTAGGHDWEEIWNLDVLRDPIAFRAIANLCLSNANNSNSWEIKYNQFDTNANSLLASVQLLIDTDTDGEADGTAKNVRSVRLVR